jgi:hypothetical protein
MCKHVYTVFQFSKSLLFKSRNPYNVFYYIIKWGHHAIQFCGYCSRRTELISPLIIKFIRQEHDLIAFGRIALSSFS